MTSGDGRKTDLKLSSYIRPLIVGLIAGFSGLAIDFVMGLPIVRKDLLKAVILTIIVFIISRLSHNKEK